MPTSILANVLRKAPFWASIAGQPLGERQHTVINRLLDGFAGKLNSSKWATLTKTSADTALRDINDLVARGILVKDAAGGRSTSYSLVGYGAAGDTEDAVLKSGNVVRKRTKARIR